MSIPFHDRMPPIPQEQWTDAQKNAADEFGEIRGQEVFGPFAVMLRSPEVMLRAAAMGEYMRYRTVLPARLNEFIILLTARHWTQQFEWHVHQPAALKAGLEPRYRQRRGRGPPAEGCRSDKHRVRIHERAAAQPERERSGLAAAAARFGEQGVIDMVGVAGYYSFLSMMMNTARTPVPADSPVPLLP